MPVKVLLRGFAPDIPEDQPVTFSNDLPDYVLCIQCNNISSKLYRDPRGHGYCGCCKRMCTTENGFNCSTCDQDFLLEMLALDETIRSKINKEMVVCPHSTKSEAIEIPFSALKAHLKGCSCEFGKQDKGIQPKGINPQVLNKSSGLKTKVECPLCSTLQDRKAVGIHMSEQCPKRVVECNFCKRDVEAWEKQVHEESCRQRPGTCEHCLKQFRTVAELEDEHHPKCPEMPVNCPFHKLGCTFVAARREVPSHELATTYADMLVEHMCQLKAENEFQRTITQKDNDIDRFKETVSALQEVIQSFQRTIEEKDNDIQHLKVTMSALQADLKRVTALQDDLKSKNVQRLEETTTALQGDVKSLHQTTIQSNCDTDILKRNVSLLQEDMESLQTEWKNEMQKQTKFMLDLKEWRESFEESMAEKEEIIEFFHSFARDKDNKAYKTRENRTKLVNPISVGVLAAIPFVGPMVLVGLACGDLSARDSEIEE